MTSNVENANKTSAEQVYKLKQQEWKKKRLRLQRLDYHLSIARGLTFLVLALLIWLTLVQGYFSPALPFFLVLVFLVLLIGHSRVIKRLKKSEVAQDYYTGRLGHLAGNWSGLGNSGSRYYDDEHPYSSDLDLFVEGGLFEYICGTPTRLGDDTLAHWLCAAADFQTINERQIAINELRDHIELLEELALLEKNLGGEGDQNQLARWCQSETIPVSRMQFKVAACLGFLALASFFAWTNGFGYYPFVIIFLLEIGFFGVNFRKIQQFTAETAVVASGLTILSQELRLIEDRQFDSPLLQRLCDNLQSEGRPPSYQIARINNLVQWMENSFRNQFFAPIAFLTGAPFYFMTQIAHWREKFGTSVPLWYESIGQIEALCSLARHSFENPDDVFPKIIADSDPATFEAQSLAHPLISKHCCVSNDLSITSSQSLTMVSGSNMSGKSTLLRTVGINVVLASCGAPVRATRLLTSRFQIGCAMRANDSLQQGASLFYSVVSRIKSVVELAGNSPPLLFLLDEILQGTNSHDRRIGAEGIIRQLINKDAVGLITTHDLALTKICDSLDGTAVNIHFDDHLENGQMHFDYKIKPGVVEKSNALELMRMMGLEVGPDIVDSITS